jgi:transcriptional regulator GlxA family with amidase domain
VREVLVALLPELVLLDVAGPAEAFRIANQSVPDSYVLRYVSPRRRVTSGIGLELGSLEPLPRRVAPDSIVVIPGMVAARVDATSAAVRELVAWLGRSIDTSVTLMCVCAGAILAARAGLLAGRDCTTHHACIEELRRTAPTARVHDNRIFVADGHIVTSAGITAGIDLALHLVSGDLGPRAAGEVARDMVVYLRRAGADPALSPWLLHRNHLHPAVHRVQDAVTANPTGAWSAPALARVACTSPRHLARLFAEHAGCSPLDYVQRLRIALARDLITQTDLAMERVAERAGFASAHHLRRVWRRWESGPPAAVRTQLAG